jgi:hypothetical protein
MIDKIIQISACSVQNTMDTQCNYLVFGLSENGNLYVANGNYGWVLEKKVQK